MLHYLQKTWTGWLVIHCIVQCDALTNQKVTQRWDCRLWKQFLKNTSRVQEVPCRWVALPHARKTKLTRETCIIQNTHHVSKQHLKHLHQTIQDIQKGILRLISITLRDCQNNYSSLLKSLQSKNILKNVMLQDFMTKRSMHIKQFTEAFQWDGQSLAPRAYGGWGWAGGRGGAKNEHPSSNQNNVFSQQTSNKIWSAIVLHPQK